MADPLDILMPGGQPLGVPTKRSDVREINGSTLAEAKVLFDKLTVAGTAIAAPRYAGTMIRLPTGGTIGLRTIAGRSPRTLATIDIDIPGCPIRKVKFNP